MSYKIIYHYKNESKTYDIQYKSFVRLSEVFKKKKAEYPEKLKIEGHFPFLAFDEFIGAIQGNEYSVNFQNFECLYYFGNYFQIPQLIADVEEKKEYILTPQSILNFLEESLKNNEDIDPYIEKVVEIINHFLDHKFLFRFPLDFILKVLEKTKIELINHELLLKQILFSFKKNNFDPNTHKLFNYLKISELSLSSLQSIFTELKNLDHKLLNTFSKNCILDLLRRYDEFNKKKQRDLDNINHKQPISNLPPPEPYKKKNETSLKLTIERPSTNNFSMKK